MAIGSGTSVNQILPSYSERKPDQNGEYEIGQIVRTVVPDLGDRWKIFDAERSDQTSHSTVSGTVRHVDPTVDYRPKPSRLPVYHLQLGECEEILAIHSKMRPCVVLGVAGGIHDTEIPAGTERNIGRNALRHRAYCVAPGYSASQPDAPHAFGPTMTARIQCLMYPQFVYLPTSGGIIRKPTIVRLDRAFWTTLPPPVVPEPLLLSKQRMGILSNQLLVLHGKEPDAAYLEMVKLLRSYLAPEYDVK